MARTTRSKAAAAAPDAVTAEVVTTEATTSVVNKTATATKPGKEEPKDDSRSKSHQRRALRRKLYKKAKRHQDVEELHKTLASTGKPMSRKEKYALRAQMYQPYRKWARGASKKVSDLENLVRKQQEEIRELRKLAVGGGIPKLQPPASPPPAGPEEDAEPDSSPAKIRDQLFADAARSPGRKGGAAQDEGTTFLEVEEVVERLAGEDASGEPMEGVQETTTTTVITSVEQDVEYPTLPSVEITQADEEENNNDAEADGTSSSNKEGDHSEVAAGKGTRAGAAHAAPKLAADTPSKLSKEEVRDSSAEDSNAGTPRNVRRSPRKKAKRRSFAG